MTFDPLVEERMADGVVVPRDPASGDPYIVPRGQTEAIRYNRASSLADFLAKDIFGIKRWEMRYLARGLGKAQHLAQRAGVETYSTGPITGTYPLEERKASAARLDLVIAEALQVAGIHEAADVGTVIHAATEPGFGGFSPPEWKDAVAAYHELTAGLVTCATEVFVANDATRTAGTFDHGYYIEDQKLAAELSEALGHDLTGLMIGDKKTGKNTHIGDFEVQLGGTYANGEVYLGPPIERTVTSYGERVGIGEMVDQRITLEDYFGMPINRKTGLIVHVPLAGSPKPRILPIDLERGYRLGLLAAQVRDGRAELDKIGVPKKLDTPGIAHHVLKGEVEDLCLDLEVASPEDKPALRARGLALHARFKTHWLPEYTTEIAKRLA